MVRRSLGSLVDAAWLRRQLTRDADVVHDAAHGVRMPAKSPGFTAVALLVLAIGIGASTATASLADALLPGVCRSRKQTARVCGSATA